MNRLEYRLQLQMHLLEAAHRFFLNEGYSPTNSPKIVPFKDDEKDHLIKVQVPGKSEELFLSRSPQLYKEIACLYSPKGKVYEIGPVFRGEPIGNGRRANEFIGIDVEIKTNDLTDIVTALQEFISSIRENNNLRDHLRKYNQTPNLPDEIIQIRYDEALLQLGVNQINPDEEKQLSKRVNSNSPKKRWIILTEFPATSRGFYQINGEKTNSFDLIAEWEICSGGLRRQDVDEYFSLLDKIGWSTKEMNLYAQIKKEHFINTGGYGIGLERLAGAIINDVCIENIQPYNRIPEKPILF